MRAMSNSTSRQLGLWKYSLSSTTSKLKPFSRTYSKTTSPSAVVSGKHIKLQFYGINITNTDICSSKNQLSRCKFLNPF